MNWIFVAAWVVCGVLGYGLMKGRLELFYDGIKGNWFSWAEESFCLLIFSTGYYGLFVVIKFNTFFSYSNGTWKFT